MVTTEASGRVGEIVESAYREFLRILGCDAVSGEGATLCENHVGGAHCNGRVSFRKAFSWR